MSIVDRWRNRNTIVMPVAPLTKSVVSTMDLQKGMPAVDMKAYQEAPLRLLDSMGFKEKPSALTFDTLRMMSTKNSVVASILLTRINQVSSFTKPSRFSKDQVGYEIRLRDQELSPSDEQKDIILSLEVFLERCGYNIDPDRDDFDQFVRKIVRDSLVYDQATFEIIPDRLGRPAEFIAVDAATIRSASEEYQPDTQLQPKKGEEVKYVQVIDGQIQAWFTSKELAFAIRNPRTDIRLQPYGFSELEQLVHQITSHLYAEEYNSRFFSQGGTTKGILNIKSEAGTANQEQLESFKRQWRTQVSGMTGAWKTPVLQVPEGIEYINVSQSNREMEFEKWMNYLINISCAVYQIDPAEVNFPNNGGVGGGASSMFSGDGDSKFKNSRDKGLRPLLRFIETLINKHIISRFSDELTFNFVGMDAKSEKETLDLDTQAVKAYKTINDIRKAHDMELLEYGDVILDPSYINMVTQKEVMKQQQEQQNQQPEIPADGSFPEEENNQPNWDGEDTNQVDDNSGVDLTNEDLSQYEDSLKSLSTMVIELN